MCARGTAVKPYSAERWAEAVALVRGGGTYSAAAKLIGASVASVRFHCRAEGVRSSSPQTGRAGPRCNLAGEVAVRALLLSGWSHAEVCVEMRLSRGYVQYLANGLDAARRLCAPHWQPSAAMAAEREVEARALLLSGWLVADVVRELRMGRGLVLKIARGLKYSRPAAPVPRPQAVQPRPVPPPRPVPTPLPLGRRLHLLAIGLVLERETTARLRDSLSVADQLAGVPRG